MPTERKLQANFPPINSLWEDFWRDRDIATRDKLIEHYKSLVEKLAGYHYARRIDDDVDYDDLIQLGYTGLIESIHRYDPNSNAKFETYASYRVKGSILNGLVKMSEKREQIECRSRIRRDRLQSLRSEKKSSNQAGTFDELVNIAVGLAVGFMLEDASLFQNEEQESTDKGYSSIQYSNLRSSLVSKIESLPDKEKMIIYYHYFQGLKFEEVASAIGLTKGRVSQLHKQALNTLQLCFSSGVGLDGYL